MGYTTEFDGEVTVTPPLPRATVLEVNAFAEKRHGGDTYGTEDPGMPGFWCNWVASEDGTSIYWNGAEKFYSAAEWMQIVVDRFVKPAGCVAEGTIFAQGEESGDRWALVVQGNRVETRRARVVVEW
jgi:hypothetical protein